MSRFGFESKVNELLLCLVALGVVLFAFDGAEGATLRRIANGEPAFAEPPVNKTTDDNTARDSRIFASNDAGTASANLATSEESTTAAKEPTAPTSNPAAAPTVDANPAAATTVRAELQDELWLAFADGSDFAFLRLDGDRWTRVESGEFFETDDPSRPTIVWAHGYQTDVADAASDAFVFGAVLEQARAATANPRPYRLVVWKWASERSPQRLRKDAQAKAEFADVSGRSLGRLIARLNPADDVALVGFSFGARVVGSALETLAGERAAASSSSEEAAFSVSGRDSQIAEFGFRRAETNAEYADETTAADSTDAKSGRLSLILISGACDAGAYWESGAYGRGAKLATGVLNEYNPFDCALKFYPAVSDSRSDALGTAPVAPQTFPNATGSVWNVDLHSVLGRKHSFVDAIQATPRAELAKLAL